MALNIKPTKNNWKPTKKNEMMKIYKNFKRLKIKKKLYIYIFFQLLVWYSKRVKTQKHNRNETLSTYITITTTKS